jgi:hypothetical protein
MRKMLEFRVVKNDFLLIEFIKMSIIFKITIANEFIFLYC